ncbi:DUF1934 domain-containing protein [Aeribacillus sp. FSL K6-1121]|uniref:DUF1934 domain-containing protein n=1 Tax=Aeribacillus sp. FSL K6-1121 TaxID=2954745 RepID=UPI0030F706ED
MRVPVQIYVQNKIYQNQTEEERIEFYTTGEFFKKQHTFYLVYDEIQDDETVKTLIKISEKETTLIRSGGIRLRQRFKQGQKTYANYETPYGTLKLAAETKSLIWHTDEEKHGTLSIEYLLEINGDTPRLHSLSIQFKKEEH